jgi:hypothetical protein
MTPRLHVVGLVACTVERETGRLAGTGAVARRGWYGGCGCGLRVEVSWENGRGWRVCFSLHHVLVVARLLGSGWLSLLRWSAGLWRWSVWDGYWHWDWCLRWWNRVL